MGVRKYFSMVLSLLLVIGVIAGCSSNVSTDKATGTSTTSPTSAPAQKVKIEVWTSNRSDKAVREQLIKKYNETNKDNIEIDYRIFTDNYPDQLKLALNANQLPDLIFNPTPDLYNAGKLLNIKDWLTDNVRKRFTAAAFDPIPWVKPGDVPFIKENVTNFKLVYNKDLFKASGLDPEKPPTTWQEMRDDAKIITQKGGGKKFGLGLPLKQSVFWTYYVQVPAARSGDVYGQNGWNAKLGKFDFAPYSKYLQWWIDVNKDGSVFPGVGTYDNDMIRAQFSEGNVGMLSAASWDIGVFTDQFPAKIDWGVADFPTWDGKVKGGARYDTSGGIAVNSTSPHLEEAKKVWQFFTSDEMYTEMTKSGLGTYSNVASLAPEVQNKDRKGFAGFSITQPAKSYPPQPISDFKLINPPLKVGKVDIIGFGSNWDVMSQIFFTGKDVDKSMQALTDAYNKILDENVKAGKLDLSKVTDPNFSPMP